MAQVNFTLNEDEILQLMHAGMYQVFLGEIREIMVRIFYSLVA